MPVNYVRKEMLSNCTNAETKYFTPSKLMLVKICYVK